MTLLVAPLEALTDRELSDPERRVLLVLFSFRGKNTNTVWPSVMSIAERANIKDHTRVSKLTTSLSKKGWLAKKKRGFTGCNEYELTVPARLSNLDSETNLAPETNMDGDTCSNLDSETSSNLDSDAKYKEQTNEQTKEHIAFFGEATTKDERFDVLWQWWPNDLGNKGGREAARGQWLKIPKALHAEIASAIQAQVSQKRAHIAEGNWQPNLPHVENWLKKKRWTDAVPEFCQPSNVDEDVAV
jgi:hypothetical protein